MEAEKTLTNEEIIRELLDLLKKNTMKEQANDVFEICTYVDGLEKKIVSMTEELTSMQDQIKKMQEVDCQHFFRQIFLGYFSDIVQAFDTLRKNVCGDDYTSLHNPIVLSSVLPAYGMFHSIQILFL